MLVHFGVTGGYLFSGHINNNSEKTSQKVVLFDWKIRTHAYILS